MKGGHAVAIAVLVVVVAVGFFIATRTSDDSEIAGLQSQGGNMTLAFTSSAFDQGGSIPAKYTCDDANTNPPLEISGVPESAQSLVLIMDDPDAVEPAGQVWDHWVVFNIPSTTTTIEEGVEPEGVHGVGTSKNFSYRGPCPPDGEHRYFFKLFALDSSLDLEEGVTKAEVETAMEGHVLEQTELVGLYNRNQ